MRILVTGGGGYIGSILVPRLLELGHEVTVLDTFAKSSFELAACCSSTAFMPVRGDARDERVLADLVPRADAIIPLAAVVGAPACDRDPIAAKTINRDAILALLKRTSKAQMVVIPTTNSGYGIGESGKFCTEETPLKPISLYGTTKVEAEKAVLDTGHGISLRLATVFGMAPRMRLDLLVNDFTWRAVSDRTVVLFEAHFKRNFIHIRDVAGAFVHALDNFAAMRGEPYNVGLSSANLSKLELCQRIKQQVPQFLYLEAPVGEDPDKRDYIVSNDKIEQIGWRSGHTLDAGIGELIRGYGMMGASRYGNV